MKGTAATMEIQENLALAYRRGQKRGLRWGITKAERQRYYEELKTLGLGLEERDDLQGGPAFRRSASGADTFDGVPAKTKAAAAG